MWYYDVVTSGHKEDVMKHVGVREFRDRATQYLSGDEVLAVERHGEPIGFYIPTRPSKKESLTQALERLEETVQHVLERTGMSEDELSDLFDLKKPLPEQSDQNGETAPSKAHASGR